MTASFRTLSTVARVVLWTRLVSQYILSVFKLNIIFFSVSGSQVTASFDSHPIPCPTIRHSQCAILVTVDSPRCCQCTEYRRVLYAMANRSTCVVASDKTSITSHTNYSYLSTPEKNEKMKQLHEASCAAKVKVERLKEKLKKEIDKGVTLETLMTADLHEIMKEEEHQALTGVEDGSFQQLF